MISLKDSPLVHITSIRNNKVLWNVYYLKGALLCLETVLRFLHFFNWLGKHSALENWLLHVPSSWQTNSFIFNESAYPAAHEIVTFSPKTLKPGLGSSTTTTLPFGTVFGNSGHADEILIHRLKKVSLRRVTK